jgi:hypothetical protein
MGDRSSNGALTAAKAAVAKPVEFEELLVKLGPRGRIHAERHLATCREEPDPRHAAAWERLARALTTLAPHATKINGQQSLQFYVPDGKYKMQVFALEDLRDGNIHICCTNILEDAISVGLLQARTDGGDGAKLFQVKGSEQWLTIEQMDGKTPNPAKHYKDMLGWNRRALKISVPSAAADEQVAAIETLCALSVRPRLEQAAKK